MVQGLANNISFTVDANPLTSMHRVERVGSQTPVPVSFMATETGNVVTVSNPSITDGGTYRYFVSNTVGNDTIDFVIVVHCKW